MVHTCTPTMEHSVCIPTYLLLARIVLIDKQVNISKIVYCTLLSLDYDLILFLYFYTEDNHKSKTLPSIFLLSGGCSTTLLFLPYFIHTYTFEFFSLSSIHLSIRSFVLRPSDYCDGYIFSFFSFFLHAFLFSFSLN